MFGQPQLNTNGALSASISTCRDADTQRFQWFANSYAPVIASEGPCVLLPVFCKTHGPLGSRGWSKPWQNMHGGLYSHKPILLSLGPGVLHVLALTLPVRQMVDPTLASPCREVWHVWSLGLPLTLVEATKNVISRSPCSRRLPIQMRRHQSFNSPAASSSHHSRQQPHQKRSSQQTQKARLKWVYNVLFQYIRWATCHGQMDCTSHSLGCPNQHQQWDLLHWQNHGQRDSLKLFIAQSGKTCGCFST